MENQKRTATPLKTEEPLITARIYEGEGFVADSWVIFEQARPEERLNIYQKSHLYSHLRDALRKASGDFSWSLRYASQIKAENHAFLHSAQTKCILFDPFMPFRCPLREFFTKKHFLWQIFPSNAYYFKSQADSMAVFEQEALRARLESGTRDA